MARSVMAHLNWRSSAPGRRSRRTSHSTTRRICWASCPLISDRRWTCARSSAASPTVALRGVQAALRQDAGLRMGIRSRIPGRDHRSRRAQRDRGDRLAQPRRELRAAQRGGQQRDPEPRPRRDHRARDRPARPRPRLRLLPLRPRRLRDDRRRLPRPAGPDDRRHQLYEQLFGHVPLGTIDSAWFQYLHAPGFHASSAAVQAGRRPARRGRSPGIIALPLVALGALAIKLGDRGPVFYRQSRVGEGGREFELLKLRTMRTDAAGAAERMVRHRRRPRHRASAASCAACTSTSCRRSVTC